MTPTAPLLYHHCRAIEHVRFGTVYPARRWPPDQAEFDLDRHDELAYAWMAERCGFWPLWLAVGETDEARELTGYQNQWRRLLGTGPDPGERRYVGRGRFPGFVLFSWADAPPGVVHSAFDAWHIVLNAVEYEGREPVGLRPTGPGTEASILRRSWTPARWRREARRRPGSVQAVAPALELSTAQTVWCRSRAARRALVAMGFAPERVAVRRIAVDRW